MSKQVLVPVADGCEEIEAITIIDLLRRAGAEVTVASCSLNNDIEIHAANGVVFKADCSIESCIQNVYHLIVLPGGMPGSENLRDCKYLRQMLQEQKERGDWYAAICAAPAIVLASYGLLNSVKATCYPSFIDKLEGAIPQPDQSVVVDQDKCVVTAQGPGSAFSFSLKLIDVLYGKDACGVIAKQTVADWVL
ncbi:MAG: DJ-1/PfpI family protein [Candidatus Endonucleobacter sp. (ex Gigantidas childressi)]|nr:DJ-1/PfpI family protein [Candidatus Endonucleobacter sp. (ex Gigantidas childressi)]